MEIARGPGYVQWFRRRHTRGVSRHFPRLPPQARGPCLRCRGELQAIASLLEDSGIRHQQDFGIFRVAPCGEACDARLHPLLYVEQSAALTTVKVSTARGEGKYEGSEIMNDLQLEQLTRHRGQHAERCGGIIWSSRTSAQSSVAARIWRQKR